MSISKILVSIALAVAAIPAAMPMASANQGHADCEDDVFHYTASDNSTSNTEDQPWIGYNRTDTARTFYNDLDEEANLPGHVRTCEGEHWDGQDTVSSAPGNCNTVVSQNGGVTNANRCAGTNPDGAGGWTETDPLGQGFRVSTDGRQVYSGVNIVPVGRAVVYTDGQGMVAVYVEDSTPGNVLATVVSTARVTQGSVSEADCDQSVYQSGARSGDARCGRDNTAITVHVTGLP